MKFSVFAIAALAAATSSSCMVAAAAPKSKKSAKKVTNGPNNGPNGGPYGGPTNGDIIPIGDPCMNSDDCAIPPGWDHGFCTVTNGKPGTCQSGDIIPVGDECPNQYNVDKDRYADDHCAIPLGLDHGVCLGLRQWGGASFCQSGQPGAVCIDTFGDCVVPPGLDHPVCRHGAPADGDYDGGEGIIGKCQSGQPGSFCGQTSDCVIQTDLDPPHAVCRGLDRRCQR